MTEPILEIRKPNGGHHCEQLATIHEMSTFQSDLGLRFIALERKIGGPDPLDPLKNIGLIGAVQNLTNNVSELISAVKDSRRSIADIEEKEEVTGIQSRDALVLRMHAAEKKAERLEEETRKRAAQIEADAWAEAKARAEWKRQLTIKVVAIVGAALTSSAGLVWLARVFQ